MFHSISGCFWYNEWLPKFHQKFRAPGSPPLFLRLSPRNKLFYPKMEILILLHVHSLLSLLYEGWADAESTGGLIHLWKQVVIIIIFIIIVVIIIFIVVIIIVIIVAIDLHVEEGLILVSSPTR